MKEKRKLRFIEGKRTLTTYRRFKKRFPTSIFEGKRKYKSVSEIEFTEFRKLRKKKIKKEIPEELPEKRIRKQIVLNMRSDDEPYAMSVRAITINPGITEEGLKLAILETLREINIDLSKFYRKEFGFEAREIPEQEDRRLNDFRVHIEILIRREPPINFIK